MFPEVFLNFSVIFQKNSWNFPKYYLKFVKEVFLDIFPYFHWYRNYREFLGCFMMSIELIKINDSKNLEFEFLIFNTKTKLLQNFNETTHWNFPPYLIGFLSLIPDISAAQSELVTRISLGFKSKNWRKHSISYY